MNNPKLTDTQVAGSIVALELYYDNFVTCLFMAENGGTFHDLPFNAITTTPKPIEYLELVYCKSPDTNCEFQELKCLTGELWVYPRHFSNGISKPGRYLGTLCWPKANVLLHLVEVNAQLMLWPPHKIMWKNNPLPAWKKARYNT